MSQLPMDAPTLPVESLASSLRDEVRQQQSYFGDYWPFDWAWSPVTPPLGVGRVCDHHAAVPGVASPPRFRRNRAQWERPAVQVGQWFVSVRRP